MEYLSGQNTHNYTPLQNVLGKIKKSNKVRKYGETFISFFAYFLCANAKIHFFRGNWELCYVPMKF